MYIANLLTLSVLFEQKKKKNVWNFMFFFCPEKNVEGGWNIWLHNTLIIMTLFGIYLPPVLVCVRSVCFWKLHPKKRSWAPSVTEKDTHTSFERPLASKTEDSGFCVVLRQEQSKIK